MIKALSAGAILLAAIAGALLLNSYYSFVIGQIALLAIAGLGLNILIGLSGQMSFGHAGFYALGAYSVAIATSRGWLSFWIAWPLGALITLVVGALLALPALRVRGPYLAMVTIAFGIVIEQILVEGQGLTGGQNGILDIPPVTLAGWAIGDRGVEVLAIVTAAAIFLLMRLIAVSPWGLAMRAVRDSETAAASIGIDATRIRIAAFAISAACAGLAGGLFAPMAAFVTPQSADLGQSILLVLVVVIGGAGSNVGPLIGAVVIGVLPELLASMEGQRLLFYGAMVLLVLWIAPGGIAGLVRRPNAGVGRGGEPAKGIWTILAHRERAPLKADGLAIRFGGLRAVDGLSLAVEPGRILALIGPNGAGKSTALNMLSGFYRPDEGQCALGDRPLPRGVAHESARAGVARTYQTSALFGSLSVEDNVLLAMPRGRLGFCLVVWRDPDGEARRHARALLAACGYAGSPATPASDLAHVDRRWVEIARALALDPDVLLLDEPAAGLSQAEKRQLADLLRMIAAAGIGVCLVEHDMGLVMGAADHIVVLQAGVTIATGTADAIKADAAVRQAYLGHGVADLPKGERTHPTADAECLDAYAVEAGYGGAPVLHGVDLSVRRGEAIALLGPNGAGKSTLMGVLSGLIKPSRGQALLDGRKIDAVSPRGRVCAGMVMVPEGRQVFPELSVRDNIRLGGFTRTRGAGARLERMLDRFPRLRERLHQRAGSLSGGEQQMLAVARALMAEPHLLLLDEPSLGLSPVATTDLFGQLDALHREGMSLLIADQQADLTLHIASRFYALAEGRVGLAGNVESLADNPDLASLYFSEAAES